MFDTLGERLNKALDGVRGSGNLTEDQVKKVTREIRLALLEADVNYSVVKEFVSNVRERATGAEDSKALSPGQQVVDVEMMEEIRRVRKASKPHSVLLVLDVVTGQNAVEVAEAFQEYADFDGMVLTKLDGDARGGGALSPVSVTRRPIPFASEGEKMGEFDYFYPDRMAGRILGMGDVLTLIEKAEKQMDRTEAEAQGKKLMSGKFTFEDFLQQMQMIKKMGPLSGLLGMIPGLGKQLKDVEIDDRQLGRVEAMITSMTVQERRNPKLLQNPSRARRIARGSGATQQDVQKLVKQFKEMQKMMAQMGKGGGMPRIPGLSGRRATPSTG